MRSAPEWMLVAPHGGGSGEACNITGDTKTMAAAITSSGHRIVVSVCREPSSPALSLSRICLCFQPDSEIRIPGTDRIFAPGSKAYYTVVAAHGGSLLLHITSTEHYMELPALDYFVYTNVVAGAAADPARPPPPSLHLLPPPPSQTEERHCWLDKLLDVYATGFLCRGEAGFVVAQLKMPPPPEAKDAQARAELLLFRNGEWRVKRPFVVHCHGRDGDLLLAKWKPEAVVPVGDGGVLCWVDFSRGVILCDVFHHQTNNVLWYVPYPAEARATSTEVQCFVCTNTRGELKLVSVSPRRCSHCGCSQHASAVDTWTLDTDHKAWVLETGTMTSMVDDDTELWALEKHSRQHLVYPVPVAGMNGGGGDSAAPTTIAMPSTSRALPLGDRVVRRSPRILHKKTKDKQGEYPHIRLNYGKTVQVEELKLGNGNPSNSSAFHISPK